MFICTATKQTFFTNGKCTGTDAYYYTYNDQMLVTDGERWSDGILAEKSHWEYDEFQNPIRITHERDEAVEVNEYKNILDGEGRILRQEIWVDDKLSMLREIAYNNQGKETTHLITSWYDWQEEPDSQNYSMTYDWKGNLSRKVLNWGDNRGIVVWEYKDGLCVRNTTYEADTITITQYWEYDYDQKERCIRESRYTGNGTLELYHEYLYNDEARTMTRTCYLSDGTVDNHSDVYQYDEYGNQILLEKYQDGEVYRRIEYTYEMRENTSEKNSN